MAVANDTGVRGTIKRHLKNYLLPMTAEEMIKEIEVSQRLGDPLREELIREIMTEHGFKPPRDNAGLVADLKSVLNVLNTIGIKAKWPNSCGAVTLYAEKNVPPSVAKVVRVIETLENEK